MGAPGNGTKGPLGPCPHCGETHPEDLLKCPKTGAILDFTGRLLDGKFRFIRQLGSGGMGTVWQAENVLVKKVVAVKVLHEEYARNPVTLARFRDEATSAGRIGNPHICDILDLGQGLVGPYIVMEMLRGRTLEQLIEDLGALDSGLAVLVTTEALRGLIAAHHAGVVHRDLKPENIFLHEPQRGRLLVKLMDFGISKFTEGGTGQTRAGAVMGTPAYMSPEQAEGRADIDVRSDIWSMGVILYKALTGVEPFTGPTMPATLLAVTTADPTPIDELAPEVPKPVVDAVMRCLARDPDARWPTAQALRDALEPYAQSTTSGKTLPLIGASESMVAPGPTASSSGAEISGSDAAAASVAGTSAPGEPASPTASASAARQGRAPVGSPLISRGGSWADAGTDGAAAPGASDSWSFTARPVEERPSSTLSGGSRSGLWVVFLLVLVAAGVFGYQWWSGQPGATGEPAVAGTGDSASAATAGQEPPGATSGVEASGTAGSENGAGTGTGGASTGTGGSSGGGQASAAPDGATEGSTGADADGATTSDTSSAGATPDKPKPPRKKRRPDLAVVHKRGSLFVPKALGPSVTYSGARAHCSRMRRKNLGNLRGWRLPRASEIQKFASAIKRLRYWTLDGKALSLGPGGKEVALPADAKARALCVSKS